MKQITMLIEKYVLIVGSFRNWLHLSICQNIHLTIRCHITDDMLKLCIAIFLIYFDLK